MQAHAPSKQSDAQHPRIRRRVARLPRNGWTSNFTPPRHAAPGAPARAEDPLPNSLRSRRRSRFPIHDETDYSANFNAVKMQPSRCRRTAAGVRRSETDAVAMSSSPPRPAALYSGRGPAIYCAGDAAAGDALADALPSTACTPAIHIYCLEIGASLRDFRLRLGGPMRGPRFQRLQTLKAVFGILRQGFGGHFASRLAQSKVAERVGFEPTVPRKGYNGFRDRPDRPLWHLSARRSSIRGAEPSAGGRGAATGGRPSVDNTSFVRLL